MWRRNKEQGTGKKGKSMSIFNFSYHKLLKPTYPLPLFPIPPIPQTLAPSSPIPLFP
ncbi:hypothetical protein OSCI_860032 [Kamptonema sp. PCC 6506]|nr:hypothetical protein OSCI_860032 [Kamptonema sp. PCC 6506]